MRVPVSGICIGLPRPFTGAELSAIAKRPVSGQVMIRHFGIEGDMVADPKHHGGPDMAVHWYPCDHYAGWDAWLGGHDLLSGPAAFGENLMARGLVEADVGIGARFRFGEALLEVSQPRAPCWKIEHRFARKGMVKRILRQHICGWYLRVLEEGRAAASDELDLVENGDKEWTVARVFAALYDLGCKPTQTELTAIASLRRLSGEWRKKAEKHAEG